MIRKAGKGFWELTWGLKDSEFYYVFPTRKEARIWKKYMWTWKMPFLEVIKESLP